MSKDYVVRHYQPGDEREIVDLLQLVFSGWPHLSLNYSSLDYWKWRYDDYYLQNKMILVCENKDGSIIGCAHTHPKRIKIGEKIYMCCTGQDLAVHPDYQGQGIGSKIIKQLQKWKANSNIEISFYDTKNPILISLAKKRYLIFPFLQMVYSRIHDIDLHLKKNPVKHNRVTKYSYNFLKIFNKLKNDIIIDSLINNNNVIIKEIDTFDYKIDIFWEGIKKQYNFIENIDKKLLNWRYCDKRGGNYIIRMIEENEAILGYIVFCINKYNRDYPVGCIVDLLAIPGRPDIEEMLILNSLEFLNEQEINIIQCLVVKNHHLKKILQKNGFVYSRKNLFSYYEISSHVGADLIKFEKSIPDNIHIPFGFYDWI